MIKNIIFDIGGVILNFDIEEAAKKYTNNEEERLFIKNEVHDSEEWAKSSLIDLGYISIKDAAAQINDRTNHIHDEIVEDFMLNFVDYGYVDERVIKLIHLLKDNGYKIYILSNISKEIIDKLNIRPLLDELDGYILSYEWHQIKPYKSIYETLINKYNINPQESLFIDDKKDNTDTANELGIKGHNVKKNSYESIIDLLKEYNIVR